MIAYVDLTQCIVQLCWVTAGNIVGGGLLVAAVYHLVYRRALATPRASTEGDQSPQ